MLEGPDTLQRGTSGSYKIRLGTGRNASITGWRFVGEDGQTVERTSSAVNWDGIMVTSGTVYVEGTWQGQPFPLPQSKLQVTVTPRPGWAHDVPDPRPVENGFDERIAILDPPRPDADGIVYLGKNVADLPYYFEAAEVTAGPNAGYSFVFSRRTDFEYHPRYFWSGSPALFVVGSPYYSAFEAANCGDYNAVSKPWGFGLAEEIRANTFRHEAGATQSHYRFFVDAFNQPGNNLGLVMESYVARRGGVVLARELDAVLESKISTIEAARKVEPCNDREANRDASCFFKGPANTFDVATGMFPPCPRPQQ